MTWNALVFNLERNTICVVNICEYDYMERDGALLAAAVITGKKGKRVNMLVFNLLTRFRCALLGTRTLDPLIKSQLLYQLS